MVDTKYSWTSIPINWNNKANVGYLTAAISNMIQIDFSSRTSFKFDRWPPKTTRKLFRVPRSYLCHFISIHSFKLKLSSGNTQIRVKSSIFPPVWSTKLTHDLEKTMWYISYATPSFEHYFVGLHLWIQTRVIIRKRSIWVEIVDFFTCVI